MSSISRTQLYFFIIIFGCALISAYPIYQALTSAGTAGQLAPIKNEKANHPGISVVQTRTQQLDHEHQACLENLRLAFGIDQKEWDHTMAFIQRVKQNDDLKGAVAHAHQDSTLASKIRHLLVKHSINPNRVTVEYVDKPKSACHAMAGQAYIKNKVHHFLQINTPVLEQEPGHVQDALLTHEIMHLLNYDAIEQLFIESLLKHNGIEPTAYLMHPAFDAYSKHIELRADMGAACTQLSIAQGLQKAFELHIEKYPHAPESKSHPSSHLRLEKMNDLIAQITREQKTVTA